MSGLLKRITAAVRHWAWDRGGVDPAVKPTRDLVLKKLRDGFPDAAEAAKVLACLDQYGRKSWQQEKERVQLAVLKLAGGKLDQVKYHMGVADVDYRDVLCPAEYPEGTAVGFVPKPAQVVDDSDVDARDRAQYEAWLRSDLP